MAPAFETVPSSAMTPQPSRMDQRTIENLLGPAPGGAPTHVHTNRGDDEPAKPKIAADKVGRNDVCPCGSGKKYKKCHGAATA